MATYLRLFLHEALPEIGRALYLDADVTVTGDLRPLFDLDLGHFTVACVADAEATAGPERIALKLPANATYHNAGVMLVDLSAWRSQGWPEKMIAYANSGKPLAFHDQTILNAVLAGRILTLPIKWNFTEPDRWRETLPPVIIHYAGWKPWEDPVVPYRDLYRLHRMQTPFPYDERYSRDHDRKWLRRRILAALGIPAYRRRLDLLGRNAQIRQAITVPAVADAQRRMALRDANGVQIVERSSDREEYPT